MNGLEHLSPNFTLGEMTRTEIRDFLGPNLREAAASAAVLSSLKTLCFDLLEPVRSMFGAPVWIHSGFRMPPLNKAVGGQPGSQHQRGEAADFHVVGVDLREVFERIQKSPLPFGQLILEGRPAAWVHLSLGAPFRPAKKCREVLIAVPDGAGGMRYTRV